MSKPPEGPQTPTHPPPSQIFLAVERGFSRIDPFLRHSSRRELRASSTRFNPLVGVRFVTKFTLEMFNRRDEKFSRRCCCCNVVRPRLLICSSLPRRPTWVCPKELVLHLPRTNRRRVVGRNADEPTGHPHSLARKFPTRFKHTSLE